MLCFCPARCRRPHERFDHHLPDLSGAARARTRAHLVRRRHADPVRRESLQGGWRGLRLCAVGGRNDHDRPSPYDCLLEIQARDDRAARFSRRNAFLDGDCRSGDAADHAVSAAVQLYRSVLRNDVVPHHNRGDHDDRHRRAADIHQRLAMSSRLDRRHGAHRFLSRDPAALGRWRRTDHEGGNERAAQGDAPHTTHR